MTLNREDVEAYARLSGDCNPLHFDESFVSRTRFKRPIVQGGLTTALLSRLVGMDLPGPGTVFMSQSYHFTAPVFIGDTILAQVEVTSIHPSKPVCQLKVTISRQDGVQVLEGEAWCYTVSP